LNEDAISSILAPIRLYQNEIVEGLMKYQGNALEEAILHGDINIYLHRKEGINIKLGNTQDQLETTKRKFKIFALSTEETQVMAYIKGFPCETVPLSLCDSLVVNLGPPSSRPSTT
jgi:hypothetical protein